MTPSAILANAAFALRHPLLCTGAWARRPLAMTRLGVRCEETPWIPEHLKRAVRWHHRAADRGCPVAFHNLGSALARGLEYGPPDPVAALGWYRKAAETGIAASQFALGWMLWYGEGCEKDATAAASWFEKAAAQGHAGALVRFGLCLLSGEGAPRDVGRALDCFRKAADKGDRDGMFHLATCLHNGEGAPKDPVAALSWYLRASYAGHAEATLRFADALQHGEDIARDEEASWPLYRKFRRLLEKGGECSVFPLRYLTGEEIRAGDRVRSHDAPGVVRAVFDPGTREGRDWACPGGGFLLDDSAIGPTSWERADEDLEFVSRGDPPADELKSYWIVADVPLDTWDEFDFDSRWDPLPRRGVAGFVVEYGCTAASEAAAVALVRKDVREQWGSLCHMESIRIVDPASLKGRLAVVLDDEWPQVLEKSSRTGIWCINGRFFHDKPLHPDCR